VQDRPGKHFLLTCSSSAKTSTDVLMHRHDYRALTTKVDAELYKHNATGANSTFVFQPVPKSVAEAGKAKGGNAMNIPAENQMCKQLLPAP
jgi:hypothetical protein